MSPYFDIVFAGGGTTACVVAGRLIETDPNLKILIVEPGPHIKGIETHVQPARYFSNLASETTLARYVAKPNPALDGRQVVVPTGKCVGGGSAVNFMMYTRAAASDYDDWEKLGNPGWGAKDLIPLAEKLENYEPFEDERASHGSSGPIHISPGGHATSIGRDFLEMAALYDKDRTFAQDINDFTTCNAYGRWAKYIGHQTGERSDAAHSYIYDKPDSENLVIITGKRVNRVLFENGTATGVECVNDKGPSSEIEVFNASKLVVLSAGAFGSPTILERSGIGASKIINAYGIPQLVDLPGVGENYNDHNLYTPTFFVDEATSDSMTELLRDVDHESVAHHLALWKETHRGLLAHNSIDAGIKIRPTAQEVEDLGPEFQPIWNSFYAPAPDKPLYFIGPSAGYLGKSPVSRKAMSMIYYAEYLASIGTVHISSTDPHAPVDFDCAYLTDRFDVIAARYAYKRSREYARRMTCFRGEYVSDQPAFPSTGAAALQAFANPTPPDAPDILYTAEDDEAIDAWHRARVATTWHSLGTCAMKPREAMGVVDSRLNVYGVRNLKVADLSIAPLNVSANTYNTTLIIGEKAFIIIAEDLGIRYSVEE